MMLRRTVGPYTVRIFPRSLRPSTTKTLTPWSSDPSLYFLIVVCLTKYWVSSVGPRKSRRPDSSCTKEVVVTGSTKSIVHDWLSKGYQPISYRQMNSV